MLVVSLLHKTRGVLSMTVNCIGFRDQRSAKYTFIAITPRSTVTKSSCTCKGLIL